MPPRKKRGRFASAAGGRGPLVFCAMDKRSRWFVCVFADVVFFWCRLAAAQVKASVVVWPTLTPAGDAASSTPLHRPAPTDKVLLERAQELDATLRDAVQDLGFTLDVADAGPAMGRTR